ncbi:acyltransferase domain-containing protein [Nonomuraea sp. CA-143628]|uniref:acyltransferase domain-containing protein n=1 Tax=Nonomuraea sp. CA-143628 TaxID=3239997 RepID=UPI003D8BA8F9
MALAYIIDGGLHDQPGLGADLYEAYPAVSRVYGQVAEWTGVPVERLLSWGADPFAEYREVGAIRRAAVVLGLCDVLAEQGVRPDIVAGMSVGAMTAAAVVGAVGRRELFELLARLREIPLRFDPPQGMAKLFVPAGLDPEEFVGGFPEGVYVAVEIGRVAGRSSRLVQLAGHREALDRLAERMPDKEALEIPPESSIAFHSPLRNYVREALEPQIATMAFANPEVPFCGGMEPGLYATADQVREVFRRNQTDPLSLPRMLECLDRHEVELSFLIGPAAVDLYLGALEHAAVHIDKPKHLSEALDAIQEFGMLPTER